MGTNENIIKPYRYPFGTGHHVSDFLEEEKHIRQNAGQGSDCPVPDCGDSGKGSGRPLRGVQGIGCSDQRHQLRSGWFKLCVWFTGRQHGCHRIRFCHTGPGQHCIPVCPGKSSLLYRNSGICGKMDW